MWSEFDDEFIGEERNGFGRGTTTVDPKRLIVNRHLIHLTCSVFLDYLGVFVFISMLILVCPNGNFLRGIDWD